MGSRRLSARVRCRTRRPLAGARDRPQPGIVARADRLGEPYDQQPKYGAVSDTQISAILATQALENEVVLIPVSGTGFPQPLTSQMPGDYDRNGTVDASDYVLWRNNSLNSTSNLAADGNKNGIVDQGDLTVWRSNFGRSFAGSRYCPAITT